MRGFHGIAWTLGLKLAGISSCEGSPAGIAFGEARSDGNAFGEGDSDGIAFGEARKTVFQQNRPRQSENQQILPRQTKNRQNFPRQTQKRQKPGGRLVKTHEVDCSDPHRPYDVPHGSVTKRGPFERGVLPVDAGLVSRLFQYGAQPIDGGPNSIGMKKRRSKRRFISH